MRRAYLLADGWDPSPFRYLAAALASKSGWDIVKMPRGHDAMVDLPNELAAELGRLA